jgi:hypothetical protein
MGAIMAVKTPLSAFGLRSLHGNSLTVSAATALRPLGSLLSGLTNETQPIRILHLSFREFVTVRAEHLEGSTRFYISEKEHNERLSLMCLLVLNRSLNPNTPGTDYLTSPIPGVPEINYVSEELWYACQFWTAHIVEVEAPVSDLVSALRDFFSTKVVLWMEVLTSKGHLQKLLKVREWLQVRRPSNLILL